MDDAQFEVLNSSLHTLPSGFKNLSGFEKSIGIIQSLLFLIWIFLGKPAFRT